jgi:hypothetical protein
LEEHVASILQVLLANCFMLVSCFAYSSTLKRERPLFPKCPLIFDIKLFTRACTLPCRDQKESNLLCHVLFLSN